MAQKTKVKELVGRGLHSYHTKALQQIDRIEKKNKEQSHKISILSNELDNDYLTKTEEGSVISLEHSKEGMVYLDELQGNTLVNYCTDGSKEMTLNGDIDVEGTFVTTTEGVDNGKVDVMCEGNTLVNKYFQPESNSYLANNKIVFAHQKGYIFNTHKHCFDVRGWSRIITVISTTNKPVYLEWLSDNGTSVSWGGLLNNEILKSKIELPSNCSSITIGGYTSNGWTVENAQQANILILEGDWTNKEVPPYFEGMKSVGECEDNKIEILSTSKNHFIKENVTLEGITISDGKYIFTNTTSIDRNRILIDSVDTVKNGEKYTISCTVKNVGTINSTIVSGYDFSGVGWKSLGIVNAGEAKRVYRTDICNDDLYGKRFILGTQTNGSNLEISDVQIENGDIITNYIDYKSNKKEILLNEPLRGLPNGVKDRFVKIGGKWFIERNCAEERVLDTWDWIKSTVTEDYYYYVDDRFKFDGNQINVLCNKFKSATTVQANNTDFFTSNYDYIAIGQHTNVGALCMDLNPNTLVDKTLEGFKEYIRNNEINIIYPLQTPIYEPLEIEPTLGTYNEVTHISNNSIIPCNMKIKNTGYNAIIKPSTLYIVALDTNKSGTIGMNLGGAKVTTTNNVATITTPATLSDDSLRLYGKGIKGYKVRLLEGDKTNWIPSHFEGMKSCFEDKFDATDNTYKMEILSNNKNLFDITKVPNETTVENLGDCLKITGYANDLKVVASFLTPNKTYTTSTTLKEIQGTNNGLAGNIRLYNPKTGHWITSKTFIAPQNIKDYGIYLYGMQGNPSECIVSNMQIFEGNEVSLYTPHKSNKIQFSSIEPLRSAGNIKDKFIFKDGQLMIERNLNKVKLTRNHVRHFTPGSDGYMSANYCAILLNLNDEHPSKRGMGMELLCNQLPSTKNDIWTGTVHREGISGVSDVWDFSIKLSNTKTGLTLNDKDNASKVLDAFKEYLDNNVLEVIYHMKEPTYEEIPFELQKIILEGYENGTLFFDTNIPPTSTVTYAGETPIVKATKLNKTEVLNNTNDINDNIVPYLMDMDYRVVCLQLEGGIENVSMARLFGGTYEMLQRDILSNRYSKEEYKYRLDAYLSANKITEDEYNKLGDMLND